MRREGGCCCMHEGEGYDVWAGRTLGAGVIFLASTTKKREPHHAVRPALTTSPAVCTDLKAYLTRMEDFRSAGISKCNGDQINLQAVQRRQERRRAIKSERQNEDLIRDWEDRQQ
ncbi:hypothetical protein KCU64_g37, partial [Aureobasidium melanogenum]